MRQKGEDKGPFHSYPLHPSVKEVLLSFKRGDMTVNDALIYVEHRARDAIASENPPRVELSPLPGDTVWLDTGRVAQVKYLASSYAGRELSLNEALRVLMQLAGAKDGRKRSG